MSSSSCDYTLGLAAASSATQRSCVSFVRQMTCCQMTGPRSPVRSSPGTLHIESRVESQPLKRKPCWLDISLTCRPRMSDFLAIETLPGFEFLFSASGPR